MFLSMINSLKKLFLKEKRSRERFSDVKQEILNRAGREQFEKILKRGLTVPVVML